MQSTTITITGLFLTLTLTSCDSSGAPTAGTPTNVDSTASKTGTAGQGATEKTVLPSGLAYTVLKEGQGDSPKLGSAVLIHCVGRLANGQEFWNTRTAAVPQREVLSHDQLIAGVLEALLAMKPGERRQLHIPSDLGYGIEGYRPVVPPRADLEMDLELVSVEP